MLAEATARAQQPAADSTQEAQSLFNDALSLFEKGSYEAALKAFEDVNKKFPSVGALGKIGECYEKLNKPAKAWEFYNKAAETAHAKNDTAREKVAREKAAALEGRLPKLMVPSPVDGLEVRVNGELIPPERYNQPLRQGPGRKDIVARAPGFQTSTTQANVSDEGQPAELTVPALERSPDPGKTQKTIGVVVGGVGVVGVALGSVFGIMALGDASDRNKLLEANNCAGEGRTCPGNIENDSEQLKDDAKSKGLISTIGFAAGGALIVGGVILFLTAPKSGGTEPVPEPRTGSKPFQLRDVSLVPATGPQSTGVVLSGRF